MKIKADNNELKRQKRDVRRIQSRITKDWGHRSGLMCKRVIRKSLSPKEREGIVWR